MTKRREDTIKPINQISFGDKVYRARIEMHMSVADVAGHLGISEIFLRQIEMGRKIPSLLTCGSEYLIPSKWRLI